MPTARLPLILALVAGLGAAGAAAASSAADVAAQVRAATGSPTRMAWVRDGVKLVLFDTEDRRGEREIPFRFRINRPVITPTSGDRVVFIVFEQWATWIVNWDGTNPRKLVDGRVTCIRLDEKGVEWMYWQDRDNVFHTAPLDRPAESSIVWKLPVKPREGKTENFQVSADGRFAASNIPWPAVGVGELPQQAGRPFKVIGQGCWPQMARDNSYRCMHCTDGSHTQVQIYDIRTNRSWRLPIGPNGRGGAECPRWANDPRFIIITDRPAKRTRVYLARFNDDFTKLVQWITISSVGANSEAEIWIRSAARYPGSAADEVKIAQTPQETAGQKRPDPQQPPDARWPGVTDGLLYLWEKTGAPNQYRLPDGRLSEPCTAELHGQARPSYFSAIDTTGGRLEAEGIEQQLLDATRASGLTLEMAIVPRDASAKGIVAIIGTTPDDANLLLMQENGRLLAEVLVKETAGPRRVRHELLQLASGRVHHLIIALGGGRLTAYLNGRETASLPLKGDLSAWKKAPLFFGDAQTGGVNWSGRVEGVAVFSRAFSAEDAASEFQYAVPRLTRRLLPRQVVVEAKVSQLSELPPDLTALLPYRRAMLFHEYEVLRVLSGKLDARKIQVGQWAVFDLKPYGRPPAVGQVVQLTIESGDDHPWFEGERKINDHEDPDVPLFIESAR